MAAHAGPVRAESRFLRVKQSLSPAEWRRVGGMTGVIVGLHVVGFGILLLLVVPHGAFGLGVGITAYTLGLRHAFDADHIGAIDNTTRKLMNEGQRPLSVGFFFSLGHSTIVFLLGLLVVGRHPRAQRRGAEQRLHAAPGHRPRRARWSRGRSCC